MRHRPVGDRPTRRAAEVSVRGDTLDRRGQRPGERGAPPGLAPVVAYLEAHADEPLTPQELARVGCMSVRALHASFQQALGETPMSYLRRVRLERVRAELLRGDPARVRVTDVAVRWGFSHQSRFAQQYRDRFGELPSRTLRS